MGVTPETHRMRKDTRRRGGRSVIDLVAPFDKPGDPLADGYRAATMRIPRVRLAFSNEEAAVVDALLAGNLERNVPGDAFTEDSFVIEPTPRLALLEPGPVARHIEEKKSWRA